MKVSAFQPYLASMALVPVLIFASGCGNDAPMKDGKKPGMKGEMKPDMKGDMKDGKTK